MPDPATTEDASATAARLAAEDHALARQARTDREAFAELYRRHLPRVYRYLVARLGDVPLAQDVAAQTFLAALEGIASFRGEGTFLAWLLLIARNKAVDAQRTRRATLPLEAAADLASADPSPERIVGARLEVEAVLRALRPLAPDRVEAVALRIFGGLSIAETSAVLGKSEAAVKMLVHRALCDLRERLAVRNEDD